MLDDKKTKRWKTNLNELLPECAKTGNTEAVAVLIQQGADISSSRVLSAVIRESVENPHIIDTLRDVYRAIVDNSVTWRCLRENIRDRPSPDSTEYTNMVKETMIYLLTQKNDSSTDVLSEAIELGASKMLQTIFQTEGVYRHTETESCVKYDVTGFIFSSITSDNNPDIYRRVYQPKTPYLEAMFLRRRLWMCSSIFNKQPFCDLVTPYTNIAQLISVVYGIMHLIFIIVFTVNNIPDLEELSANSSNNTSAMLKQPNGWYMVWPAIIALCLLCHYCALTRPMGKQSSNVSSHFVTHDRKRCRTGVSTVLVEISGVILPLAFCITMLYWCAMNLIRTTSVEQYVTLTAMVFLFGWLNVFNSFSMMTSSLYAIWNVLRHVFVENVILTFLPFYIPVFIGFSLALYSLQSLAVCARQDITLAGALYYVFVSGFTISNFYNTAICTTDFYRLLYFRIMFSLFMVTTALVCFNILMAMIIRMYNETKKRDTWLFDSASATLLRYGRVLPFFRYISCRPLLLLSRCVLLLGGNNVRVSFESQDVNEAKRMYLIYDKNKMLVKQ